MRLQEAIKSVYGMTCENVYQDLHGHIRPRKNPTPGLYIFDGQFFYRKNLWLRPVTFDSSQLPKKLIKIEVQDGRAEATT